MRVLLDEGVAHLLAEALTGYGVPTSPFPNDWKGLRNGRLLTRAETHGFTILLTNDRRLYPQQNMSDRTLAIVALPTSRPRIILQRAEDIAKTLAIAAAGDCITINFDGSRRRESQGSISLLPPLRPFTLDPI